jgi:DinB superfamily
MSNATTATRPSPLARGAIMTRAESLAQRLEAGAMLLAQLAESLTDAEWTAKVRDGRSVGVIVHHVASMYPIEMDVALTVAKGQPVIGVTWEKVAEINAAHAKENAGVTKAAALALLSKNSQEAAKAIRGFTDLELDTMAPFSLSFDAPMTAQFVLEDHAVRHAWHHVARIRSALKK